MRRLFANGHLRIINPQRQRADQQRRRQQQQHGAITMSATHHHAISGDAGGRATQRSQTKRRLGLHHVALRRRQALQRLPRVQMHSTTGTKTTRIILIRVVVTQRPR